MAPTPAPVVRFARLAPPALQALLAGDLATAREVSGAPLTPWFLSADVTWLWRLRLDQIAADPASADWIVRAAVTVPEGTVVGAGGFHGPPDTDGLVEIGYSTDPGFRRRGYARAMVTELLRWAAADPAVTTVRASISPGNKASLATIAGFGFTQIGEQWDDEDGLEHLFERPAR
jgi:[ribosomal protein S5]-alanine N-acetyltransferase